MTISPLVAVAIVAIIITLALGCFCFAVAWNRAEAENAALRRHRALRAIGSAGLGEKRNG